MSWREPDAPSVLSLLGIAFQRWDRNTGELSYDTYWEGESSGSRPADRGPRAYFENELPVLASLLSPSEVEILPSITSSSVRDRSRREAEVTTGSGVTRIGDRTYRWDAEGFLESWTVPGREEIERVSRQDLYYWMHTGNGDESMILSN